MKDFSFILAGRVVGLFFFYMYIALSLGEDLILQNEIEFTDNSVKRFISALQSANAPLKS